VYALARLGVDPVPSAFGVLAAQSRWYHILALMRSFRSARLLLSIAFVILAVAGPASAATRRFSDAADASGIDIRSVRVHYGDWLRITAAQDGRVRLRQTYRFWVDTKPSNPGPEYYYMFHPNTDSGVFKKVDGFRDSTKQSVRCGRAWGGTADAFRPHQPVVALVSGRCLGDAATVRVSMRFTEENGSGDWAPGFHALSRWVSRY
jgi:hypothetical protein